jgi:hypothetical protein
MDKVKVSTANTIIFSEFYCSCFETGDYKVLQAMMALKEKVRLSRRFGRVYK